MSNPTRLDPYLASAKARRLAFYCLIGLQELGLADIEPDQRVLPAIYTYLQEHGFPVSLQFTQWVGHDYPTDMVAFWQNALAFIEASQAK